MKLGKAYLPRAWSYLSIRKLTHNKSTLANFLVPQFKCFPFQEYEFLRGAHESWRRYVLRIGTIRSGLLVRQRRIHVGYLNHAKSLLNLDKSLFAHQWIFCSFQYQWDVEILPRARDIGEVDTHPRKPQEAT